VLWLVDRILENGVGVLDEVYEMHWFPGDDLFAANRPRGLPIGNLTSQFWANVYLNPFDQFVKRSLKCRRYLRYVDDFLLFADDKHTLNQWQKAIIDFLAEQRLTIHENIAQPRPVSEGLPFLGFIVFPDHRRPGLKPPDWSMAPNEGGFTDGSDSSGVASCPDIHIRVFVILRVLCG
jgi:hypothetical protein